MRGVTGVKQARVEIRKCDFEVLDAVVDTMHAHTWLVYLGIVILKEAVACT